MKVRFLILIIAAAALLLAGCSQNMDVDNSGERLEDSPKPVVDPNAAPLARKGAEGKPDIPPLGKAFFMHTWVEALYGTTQHEHPDPKWASPWKEPVTERVC